jgi:hypothetical protein
VTVTEGADRVLVDEGHLPAKVVHRLDVVGGDAGGIPRLTDQRRTLVRPRQRSPEAFLARTISLQGMVSISGEK